MKSLVIFVAFACSGCVSIDSLRARIPLGRKVPQLFKVKEFTCVTLAEAANHYIALGEVQAIQELKALEENRRLSRRSFNRDERIGWVCRIIYAGKGDKSLRPPYYGGLDLPVLTMPMERWPLYPIAETDGVYFVLSEGCLLGGLAERASEYVDYCSSTGEFRKTSVAVPTHDEAVEAFHSFKSARRWTMIKWIDKRPWVTYTMDEDWVLSRIEKQATLIPKD